MISAAACTALIAVLGITVMLVAMTMLMVVMMIVVMMMLMIVAVGNVVLVHIFMIVIVMMMSHYSTPSFVYFHSLGLLYNSRPALSKFLTDIYTAGRLRKHNTAKVYRKQASPGDFSQYN